LDDFKTDCEQALARALCSGGDFAELFAEDTSVGTIALQSDASKIALSGREHGAGIRIFKGTARFMRIPNDTSLPGLLALAIGGRSAWQRRMRRFGCAWRNGAREAPSVSGFAATALKTARKTAMLKQAAAPRASDYDSAVKQVNGTMLERRQNVLSAIRKACIRGLNACYVRMAVTAVPRTAGKIRRARPLPAPCAAMSFTTAGSGGAGTRKRVYGGYDAARARFALRA
jgi:TldD protein